jgi:hypothetical protein
MVRPVIDEVRLELPTTYPLKRGFTLSAITPFLIVREGVVPGVCKCLAQMNARWETLRSVLALP